MGKPARLVVDQLIYDLEHNPKKFQCGDCTLRDTATKMEYWVANGWFAGAIWRPYRFHFGMYHSFRFHMALRRWKAWTMIDKAQSV